MAPLLISPWFIGLALFGANPMNQDYLLFSILATNSTDPDSIGYLRSSGSIREADRWPLCSRSKQDFSVPVSSDGAGFEALFMCRKRRRLRARLRDHHKHLAKASNGALQRECPTITAALPVLRVKVGSE